jgi:hypothetical protein
MALAEIDARTLSPNLTGKRAPFRRACFAVLHRLLLIETGRDYSCVDLAVPASRGERRGSRTGFSIHHNLDSCLIL